MSTYHVTTGRVISVTCSYGYQEKTVTETNSEDFHPLWYPYIYVSNAVLTAMTR